MKLTEKLDDIENWVDLKEGQYVVLNNGDTKWGLVFKCPGCVEPLSISQPTWQVDFDTLTASPSIRHQNKEKTRGCGWHGHLKDGEFNGQIE